MNDAAPPVHERLQHLSFLLGDWHGFGVVGYPTMTESRFEQEVSFTHDGRPFLAYTSRTWLVDDEGNRTRQSASETGYWRPGAAERDVELLLVHPSGVAEIYYGEVVFRKVELRTDVVARTHTAKEVSANHRLYGIVEGGDLAYAVDMAAVGEPLQAHFSARLSKRD